MENKDLFRKHKCTKTYIISMLHQFNLSNVSNTCSYLYKYVNKRVKTKITLRSGERRRTQDNNTFSISSISVCTQPFPKTNNKIYYHPNIHKKSDIMFLQI